MINDLQKVYLEIKAQNRALGTERGPEKSSMSCLSAFGRLHAGYPHMTSDSDRLIPVKIFNIYPYADVQQGMGGPQNFLVFLKGEENRVVPITIGHFEGQALAMALRKIPLPRPLPHNLLQNLLDKMKARARKLVIHTLKDDVFHAYLLIQTQDDTFYLDCRPSDGMILATLIGTPIFMSPEVMQEAGRVLEIEEGEEGEDKIGLNIIGAREGSVQSEKFFPEDAGSDGDEGGEAGEDETPMSELDKLKAQLDRLIAEEAYEEAARVRDQITALEED